MAVTAFKEGIEAGLNAIQADILAANPTIDADDSGKEDCQLLALLYSVVKAIRARERYTAGTRDRAIGKWVGPHAGYAFQRLIAMIEPVYQEFVACANDVDDSDDDPWDDDYFNKGSGTTTGPMG